MDRRTVSIALALAPFASALPARAQTPRNARVALVLVEPENPDSPFLAAFRRGMRDAGWVEGRNLTIDTQWGGGVGESLDKAIAGAMAGRPDVLVAGSGLVVRPVINAGVTLPVVFVYSGDPVAGGVVESYARPGVNRTGVSLFSLQLMPKRIEFMKELMPGMKRLAIVGWPRHAGEPAEVDEGRRRREAEVQQRDQALPTGEHLRVLIGCEDIPHLLQGGGANVVERRRLHRDTVDRPSCAGALRRMGGPSCRPSLTSESGQ